MLKRGGEVMLTSIDLAFMLIATSLQGSTPECDKVAVVLGTILLVCIAMLSQKTNGVKTVTKAVGRLRQGWACLKPSQIHY